MATLSHLPDIHDGTNIGLRISYITPRAAIVHREDGFPCRFRERRFYFTGERVHTTPDPDGKSVDGIVVYSERVDGNFSGREEIYADQIRALLITADQQLVCTSD